MQRKNERFVERLPLVPNRPWLAYLVSTWLCLAALGIRLAAVHILPSGFPYVTFFPAVILSSFLFGVRPGLFATVLCGIFSWHFFLSLTLPLGFRIDTLLALGFYLLVCGTDIALVHFMQQANYNLGVERERGRILAENRETLFRELQHRVSNNIQVVAALISLQRGNVADDIARRALDAASSRLNLVGRISRALYDPSGQRLGVRTFIATLTSDILEASGRSDIAIELDVDEAITFNPDTAVPMALILGEAISNALEHGFAGRAEGMIVLRLHPSEEGKILLEVADNGCGLPQDFVPEQSGSLGLRIATALAQQLGGMFSLVPGKNGGTRALLEIPV
jgi:two-component sensor histidine kinase